MTMIRLSFILRLDAGLLSGRTDSMRTGPSSSPPVGIGIPFGHQPSRCFNNLNEFCKHLT